MKNLVFFLTGLSLLLLLFYLTPLSELFLESDAEVQATNRYIHWVLGYEIWKSWPLIGIGINTHVYYMLNHMSINFTSSVAASDTLFFLRNPIHNIHIIVAVEAGIIGLVSWIYFFFSSLKGLYRRCRTNVRITNIFNLTYIGILLGVLLYGFFGWAPFVVEVYSFCLTLGYFSDYRS